MSAPLRFAVIGGGRAGQARLRAIEAHADAALWGVVHREPQGRGPSWREALESEEVDAVAICTPNALHPEQASAGLTAGKHVLVEFPLAPTRAVSDALFERARARGRVLHVGHIELLAPSQLAQRARVRELGRPNGGALHFSGDTQGWIGDDALAGSPALRALARLQRLHDLFGDGKVANASLERTAEGYRLEIELRFDLGGQVRLIEERHAGAPRQTRWSVECERGVLDDPPETSARGVFAEDLARFIARVRGGSDARADAAAAELERPVLDWIDAIDARTLSAPAGARR